MPSHAKLSTRKGKHPAIVKQVKRKTMRKPHFAAPSRRIRGKGGYVADMLDYARGRDEGQTTSRANQFISKGAGSIATALGVPMLSGLASSAGSWLSRALGLGKYHVKSNTMMQTGAGGAIENQPYVNRPPAFGSINSGSDIVIAHSEFVQDVLSSTVFTKTQFPINAGNPILFPWFSQIAKLYEEQTLLGLVFEYKPTSATYAGTTSPAMGVVVMGSEYDCYDDSFQSKRQMEASEFCSSANPYTGFLHPIECDPSRNVLKTMYVQPGLTEVSQAPGDQRFSIPCVTSVATEGMQTTGDKIGELWVSYHMKLSRPVLEITNDPNEFTEHATVSVTATGSSISLLTDHYVGSASFNAVVSGTGNNTNITFNNALNDFTGAFAIIMMGVLGGTTIITPLNQVNLFTGDCFDYDKNLYPNNPATMHRAGDDIGGTITGVADSIVIASYVYWTGEGGVTINVPGSTTGTSNYDIWITPVNELEVGRNGHAYKPRRRVKTKEELAVDRDRAQLLELKAQMVQLMASKNGKDEVTDNDVIKAQCSTSSTASRPLPPSDDDSDSYDYIRRRGNRLVVDTAKSKQVGIQTPPAA